MTLATHIDTLRGHLGSLSASDQRFARSLLASLDRYGGLSDKQAYWVEKLATRATTPATPRESIGDLGPMVALFERARGHLRNPAIVFGTPDGTVRLSIAGDRARVPGSINVTTEGAWTVRTWYGRILRDGSFEPSSQGTLPDTLLPALRAFARDPAGQAAAHGHLTGNCCFCTRPLTDARSTAVGYGPVCADHWGLPWGAQS